MTVDWNLEVLDQLESHWQWQLRPRLDGLSDAELHWRPDADVPTIAWRLGHVTGGLAEMSGQHFGGPQVDVSTYPYAATADGALEQLDVEYARWVAGVRALGTDGLVRPQGPTSPPEFADAPVVRLVLYTQVEVIHHGAEVCLLRDLHLAASRRRGSPPG